MGFRLVPKSMTLDDLERRSGPLFNVILRNLVVSEANCVKVVDKTITMDSLRILCPVVIVCRFVNSRDLMRSTCLAIVLILEAVYELW